MNDDIEVLAQAAKEVFQQGDFGVNFRGTCSYLGDGDKSCVAGWALRLLGVTLEDLWTVQGTALSLPSAKPESVRNATKGRNMKLWRDTQRVHDVANSLYRDYKSIGMMNAVASAIFMANLNHDDSAIQLKIWRDGYYQHQGVQ